MAGNKTASTRANTKLVGTMSRIAREPVVAAAKANVPWMSTILGADLFMTIGLMIWWWTDRSSILPFTVMLVCTVFGSVAWVALRGRGGPLQFGPSGVVIGVSRSTLYVARVSFWFGRTTKLLGSWPREGVTMTRTASRSSLRGFQLQFAGVELPAQLELLQGRGKEDVLTALFGATTP